MLTHDIAAKIATDDGVTFHIATRETPESGYAVSLAAYERQVMAGSTRDSLDAHVRSYIGDHIDELLEPGNYLGAWLERSTGILFLDVTRVIADRGEAILAGIADGQLAVFCLDTSETITLTPAAAPVAA